MSANDGATIALKPKSSSAQGACSRDEPHPKLRPVARIGFAGRSQSSFSRQSKKRNSPKPVRSTRLRNCLGMIWSVSTSSRLRTETGPVIVSMAFIGSAPVADVDEVALDGGAPGHLRADEVGAPAAALASLEVAVRGRGAALAGLEDVGVHAQAHRAA